MVLFFMQDLLRNFSNSKTLEGSDRRGKGCLRRLALCLGLAVLVAFASATFAESPVADSNKPRETNRQKELSGRLEELIRQLRQERSAYYAQKSQYETQTEKNCENRKILQDELSDLRRQEAESDQQLQKYEQEVEDLKKQLVPRASLESILREQIQPFLVTQRAALENGIPYEQQERTARLEAGGGDANAPSRLSMADQLGHIWNYVQEELRLARSSETYTARAKADDGASPYARFFRVGQKILGYITEDGRQAAIWPPPARHTGWLIITDTNQVAQIRSAVEILDRRQGPKLVMLPVALASKDPDERDANASP